MTPPPPPPPPPPSFFQSYHRQQQLPPPPTQPSTKIQSNQNNHHHNRSGSSHFSSEFDSSKLHKLSNSSSNSSATVCTMQKFSTLEYCKTKQQQQMNKCGGTNGELKRSGRPKSSHNINCSSLMLNNNNNSKGHRDQGSQQHESSPAIMSHQQQPNGHYSKPKIYQQNNHGNHHHHHHHNHQPHLMMNSNNHHNNHNNRNYSTASLMRQKSDQSEEPPVQHKNNAEQLSIFDGSKKSRCILFSQIYLITHISITICLNLAKDNQSQSTSTELVFGFLSRDLIIDVYVLYILVASLIYFILLRYYAASKFNDNLTFNELTEQTPILFGAIILGFSELAQCVLELIDCMETETIILPIAKFFYHVAFMHFLLTQIIHSDYIGLRNIAIAHLLSTQVSLWMLSTLSKQQTLLRKHHCDYKLDLTMLKSLLFQELSHNSSINNILEFSETNSSTFTTTTTINQLVELNAVEPFQISLFILNNQFKFLSIFILITMWFSNNQSKINFIRAKLSEDEVIRSAYLNPETRPYLFRGFMVGSIFLLTAISSIIFYENKVIQYSSSIFIQIMITVISLCGLIIRRRQIDSNDPKYQINILKHHFITFVTLFLVYVVSMMNLITFLTGLLAKKHPSFFNGVKSIEAILKPFLSSLSYLTLIIQVTFQSYLLRLQGKKLVPMTHVFSLLAIANFSLWIIDVASIISDRHLWPIPPTPSPSPSWLQYSTRNTTTASYKMIVGKNNNDDENELNLWFDNDNNYLRNILTMFIPLNRYYCSLIFFHFWKLKIVVGNVGLQR